MYWLLACTEYGIQPDDEKPPGETGATGLPDIRVSPLVLDFGELALGAVSDPQTVEIRNVGEAALYLEGIEVEGVEFDATALSGPWLGPGESDSFAVSFSALAAGDAAGVAWVRSDDPDEPEVEVALAGSVAAPDIAVDPLAYDFGTVDVGSAASTTVTVQNTGSGSLWISEVEWIAGSEFSLDGDTAPFSLAAGASRSFTVGYAPTDDAADEAFLSFASDDPDEPWLTSNLVGDGKPFEGFSTGWYIVDDSTNYETTSNPSYGVESYGDSDGYWYEPSGAHGLVGSADPTTDFATLRDYVIARAGAPTPVTGPLSFRSTSTVPTFSYASYSYIVCDFWIDPSDDPALYEVTTGTVDDGLRVMVNGVVLGDITLGNSGAFSLADVAVPGAVNTLAVILMDNSQVDKYVYDLAFYRDGVIVSG